MGAELRVALEIGPKGKKVVAVAPDWPGLSRGAKTGETAIERLRSYLPRYGPVARLAGMDAKFTVGPGFDVVEEYQGTGSTDFWGISFAFSSVDRQAMSQDELKRELRLMRACWAYFDHVRSRVSAELQKGPRGGGRDRDQIRPPCRRLGAGHGEEGQGEHSLGGDADRGSPRRVPRRLL
jgi:hypothetical protein